MQEEEEGKADCPRVNEVGEAGRSRREEEEERGVVEEEEVVVVAR